MPIKVEFIQCDSDECKGSAKPGRLRKIAETQLSFGSACGDGGDSEEFFSCDECGAIFMQHRFVSGNYLSSEPDSYSDLRPYRYQAMREELIVFADILWGSYLDYNDSKILETRQARKDILHRLAGFSDARLVKVCKITEIELVYEKKPEKDLACCAVIVNGSAVIAWFDPIRNSFQAGDKALVYEGDVEIKPNGRKKCFFIVKNIQ